MQALSDFTMAWLQQLQKLWADAMKAQTCASDDSFRDAVLTILPPRERQTFVNTGSIEDLCPGRAVLLTTALYVSAMLPEWTTTSVEETMADSGAKKHVKKSSATQTLHCVMTDTMKQWMV